ncbi:ribosome maturation factor RimM [Aestuariimicrobium sp. p3-SID1156]|uniref:ribosome maturation factor RimM n=1 Tax=Aestuariimicrobium sp. p3-SID1156 TaxID=2916038 RepID=UPI0021AF51FD|nr:ribosome maturation factor RimM [Aestuariimicrobium sp. p3-SID1156]MCT1460293.1 ribosome maturation factor RimM [Aestuariimicrobium sp. p3-SID1156]
MGDTVEVIVGSIGKAHGVRGDVVVDVRTDEPERRFAVGSVLRVEGTRRELTVARLAWHSGRLLVHFEGLDDRNAAESARGQVLVVDVPVDEVPEEEDEYYDRQLVGLTAVLADGTRVGTVTEVVHLPEQDLLAIDVDGEERLVPFVRALVPRVSLSEKLVELADVPGLLADEDESEDAQ